MANLVIVESPSKASTIKGYLGSNYKVIASKGHVRDLPKSTLGVDIEKDFEPHYINIRGKGDLIKDIKKEAKTDIPKEMAYVSGSLFKDYIHDMKIMQDLFKSTNVNVFWENVSESVYSQQKNLI